jgi:hypothetical protein
MSPGALRLFEGGRVAAVDGREGTAEGNGRDVRTALLVMLVPAAVEIHSHS